ncbi:MAG TPA: TPM domain-containing protein [Thermoanaerobaculia bacterium]|nr:TPM domain-containing protein [Thermoanaerobaculia bacterium]
MKISEFLERVDASAVIAAIKESESGCSGEIRVHIEPKLRGRELRFVAERTFERLGMTKTALRNGVLLFIAAEEQSFIVLGDQGIHEKVGDDFWSDVAGRLSVAFREARFSDGIIDAVREAGKKLADHFPHTADDVDELLNELSVGDDE